LRQVYASEIVNVHVLADSIYLAEGGSMTRHPYGILKHYKHTSPRQACLNTIKSNHRKWLKSKNNRNQSFIDSLARIYAPIGAKNDSRTRSNANWPRLVSFFYARFLDKKSPTLKNFNKANNKKSALALQVINCKTI
jgi:hypothetical protein